MNISRKRQEVLARRLVFCACVGLALCPLARAEDAKTHDKSNQSSKSDEPPVKLRLTTTKTTFDQLEPIKLVIEMSSRDGRVSQIRSRTDPYLQYDVEVKYNKTNPIILPSYVFTHSFIMNTKNPHNQKIITKNHSFRTTIYVNLMYDMLLPGEYEITAHYTGALREVPPRPAEEGKQAGDKKPVRKASSDPIIVTVVALPEPE